MTLPSVPGVIRVDLIHTVGEDANAGCHFFYTFTGTPTQAQMDQLASDVNIEWGSKYQALCPSVVRLTEVICTDLSAPTGKVGLWTGNSVGSRAGSPLTAETCVVANFKIARRYRGGHSRNYLPLGVAGDLLDPQTWTSAFLGSLNSAIAGFYPGIVGLPGGPTLVSHATVSYYSGGTWVQSQPSGAWKFHPTLRSSPLVETVAGYGVRVKPGSQRRRMLG